MSKNRVNCWKPLRDMSATAQVVRPNANAEKLVYWAISSQAASKVEGSTTIPQGSRIQADSKSTASCRDEDIVSTYIEKCRVIAKSGYGERKKCTKQFGRDTNLRGASSSGLPQATHFFWYAWRNKIRSIGSNLASAANVGVSEQILRARVMSYAQFAFQSSTLMTVQLDELPDGVGPNYINTTHTATTVFSPIVGVNDRRGKDVTVNFSRYAAKAA